MKRVTTCALAALFASASPAFAGGLPDDDGGSYKDGGYDEPLPLWTGFYAGVHAGYADGEWDGDLKTRKDIGEPWRDVNPSGATIDGDGWFGGGQVGYNWQRDRLVLGVEGDLSWTNFEGDGSFEESGGNWTSGKNIDASLDYFGTARVRLGYAADRFMPYVTGGFAWGESDTDYKTTWEQNAPAYVSGKADASNTHVGWTIGGGVEAMLGDRWSAKAEYLYVDLGEEEYAFKGTHYDADGDVVNPDWAQDGMDTDLDFHTIRLGLNYRIN